MTYAGMAGLGLGPVGFFVIPALFILGIVLFAVGLSKKSKECIPFGYEKIKEDSSLEILKKRYVSGEISEEEFNKIKNNLE